MSLTARKTFRWQAFVASERRRLSDDGRGDQIAHPSLEARTEIARVEQPALRLSSREGSGGGRSFSAVDR